MTKHTDHARIDAEVEAIRAEYAEEEAEAAELEAAEHDAALSVPLNIRIDKDLDRQLKHAAAQARIPTSALVRRLLREGLGDVGTPVITVREVEAIARRVLTEAR